MTKENRAAAAMEGIRTSLIEAGHIVDAVQYGNITECAFIRKIDGVRVHLEAGMERNRSYSASSRTTGKVLAFLRNRSLTTRFPQHKDGSFDIARLHRVVSELVESETHEQRERLRIEKLHDEIDAQSKSACVKAVCVASTSTIQITVELPPDRAKELLVIIKAWEASHG